MESRPGVASRRGARAAALLVVTALVVTAALRLSPSRVVAGLAVAHPLWLALALVAFAAILPLWAVQWRLLAPADPSPTWRTMLGVIAMTSTVLNTTPFLVGEAAGVYFLVADAGLGRGAALSVLAMDQLFVGVAKLAVLAGAAAALPLPTWMSRAAMALVAAVAALCAALVFVAWHGDRMSLRLRQVAPTRVVRLVASVGGALAPLRSPTRSTGALALALAKKLAEAAAILCVQRAFGVALPPSSALIVLAAINLATLLPLVPGNLGVYEAAVVLAYAHLGVPAERALGIAVVQHASYFVALALPGYRWLARVAPLPPRSPAAAA